MLFVAGCGGEGVYPVTGKVVYSDGQPVQGGSITFNNTAAKQSASGDIAQDGTFSLNFGQDKGAPAGDYVVTVTGNSDTYGAPPSVANIYGDPTATPLKQTIVAGKNENVEIKVERPRR
jgi:hypothetical protein